MYYKYTQLFEIEIVDWNITNDNMREKKMEQLFK